MALPTFSWRAPDEGTEDAPETKLLVAEFGDGYTSIAPDGLNNVRRVLKLSWDMQVPTEAKALNDFFAITGQGGAQPFWYTPSDETRALKWTCKEWTDTRGRGGLRKITATFRQSFNLDT